jgi:PKHD-type hydroxylase
VFFHIKNVLDADTIKHCRDVLQNATWADGKITAGSQASLVKNNLQLSHTAPATVELRAKVLKALSENAEFFTKALPAKVFPPLFNCYRGTTNAFGNHVDNAVRTDPETAESLRTDLSFTVFISSPEDYEGGELVMQMGSNELAWKLPAGDVLLYPASTVHQVRAVTSGERLAGFSWVQSMVRDHAQRHMLSELDDTILSLRMRLGDCAETIELTSLYHNLLRQWANL